MARGSDLGADAEALTQVQWYAIAMVADGAEHVAEDDTDEDGVFASQKDHTEACVLGVLMASVIRNNPADFLRWARPYLERTTLT